MLPHFSDDRDKMILAAVASSSDAIITRDLDGTITSWNRAAERIFGYSSAEAIGQSNRLIVATDVAEEEEQALRRILARELLDAYPTVRLRRDGERLAVSLAISPVLTDEGEIGGIAEIARVVARSPTAQDCGLLERGERASSRLTAIVESSDDAIVSKDLDGTVTSWNRAAEKIFGFSASEMIGRSIRMIIPDHLQHEEVSVLARVKCGERIEHYDTVRRRKDGTLVPISLTVSPIQDADGRVIGASKIARDIGERHRAEHERQRLIGEAQAKSDFLANMSHELRTPLNAIIGFAQLMHRGKVGPVSDTHHEYLGDILTSAKHLLHLINGVLDLAKVEAGKMEFWPEPVDIAHLVNEARDTLRELAANQGLLVEATVDPAVVDVVIDPDRLKQVLYNYLSNAIKFSTPGAVVHVRVGAEEPDMFRIDVADSGAGISAADLKRLFVDFQQLDSGASKAHPGTGLGLALVKRLVEAQGGWVAVRSTSGQGSTFSAILPRQARVSPPDDLHPLAAVLPGTGTVLVVDDDPSTLKLAEIALRGLGRLPVCKSNGPDALRAAERDPPAVVIVDLLMPQMDGFEFIARLRALPTGAHVPILVWTIKDLDELEQRRLKGSTAAVVSKRAGGTNALVEELRGLLPPAPGATKG